MNTGTAKADAARETVLVVDDSEDTLELLRRHLEGAGYRVFLAQGAAPAMECLSASAIDLVVTDLKMPGISGLDLVRHIRENHKDTEVLMITGYPSVEGAVEAMRIGAADYLPKPFTAVELRDAVDRTLQRLRARRALTGTKDEATSALTGFIATSEAMGPVLRSLRDWSPRQTPVLVHGEPGTGRRSVAYQLHLGGAGAKRIFTELNCTTLSPDMIAQILFSFDRGTARGVHGREHGCIPEGLIGTIYLHDAQALAPEILEPLLTPLSGKGHGETEPPGASRPPRLVFSTGEGAPGTPPRGPAGERLHASLQAARIDLPPLRDRGEDLLLLIRHLSSRAADCRALPRPAFTDRAIETMQSYPWPGNVSELWRTIFTAVARANGQTLDVPDLPPHMRYSAHTGTRLDRSLAEVEAAYVQEVLSSVKGNRSRAAEILGIDRKTLREKLRRG